MMDYQETVAPPWSARPARPAVPFSEATRESARAPVREDLTVPAGVVAIGGLFVFLFVACVVFAVARLTGAEIDILGVLLLAGAVGALFDCIAYGLLTWHAWSGLNILGTVERVIGVDVNRDGRIGAPYPPPSLVAEIPERQPSGRTNYQYRELPGPPAAILDWARAALAGESVAYASWRDAFGYSLNRLGQREELYRKFRTYLQRHGYTAERGTHSMALTDAGREFFTPIAQMTTAGLAPLLSAENDQN